MSALETLLAVVMVGHSLFGADGPDMLQEALRAGTGGGKVSAQIINGAPLRYNWEESDKAEGIDARTVLPEGGTTDLILTEAIPLENHTTWSDTEIYAQAFAGLASSANPQTRIFVQETWHSLKSGTGETVQYDDNANIPWRKRLSLDLPIWEGIVAKIAEGNRADPGQVALIPAGQAMGRLHDEIEAGHVPGLTSIAALFADDIHLNDRGHYFVAMVQYAVLTGLDPLGLPTDFANRWGKPFDTPDPELARTLQQIAWDTVLDYRGNIATTVPANTPSERIVSAMPTGPPRQIVEVPPEAVVGRRHLGIGLAAVADWSSQVPFIDLMKTARPWIGHKPGQFGGMETGELRAGGYLDADGWPVRMPRELSSIGTLILTDMPEAAVSLEGRYRLSFDGKGVIEVAGRATNVRYGRGEVTFDYAPGPGSVDIRIQRINTSDPPRNITVVKTEHARRFASGAIFNPDWTARVGSFRVLRFMDWMQTNDSVLATWENRPRPGQVTYATGVPIEVMIGLANELGIDPWLNIPHLADDKFVLTLAETVREMLDPKLKVYVEFSNEVWNWQFTQARWADEQAVARWGQQDKWMQFYGLRAAEVAHIWRDVFGSEAGARLINVLSSQTGWLGLETEALMAPLVVADGLPAPVGAFDAYAITGYFGGILGTEGRRQQVRGWLAESLSQAEAAAKSAGLSGQAAADFVARHRYDHATVLAARDLYDGAVSGDAADSLSDLLGRVWRHHAAVARTHGLSLVAYEGGTHAVGIGALVDDPELTAFFLHFNYSTEMGVLYTTLLNGWQAVGGQLFAAYSDVYNPTKWGSWGALRHLDDVNPRWDALVGFQ